MMHAAAAWVFWISVGALLYTYAIYPLLLFLLASVVQTARDIRFVLGRRNRRSAPREEYLPRVSFLVAAHNEEAVIEAKLRNSAALEYPQNRLEVLIGLDAPNDATAQLARRLARADFQIVEFPARRGKLAVLYDLLERSSGELLVLTDANTFLEPDAIRKIVRHFADPEVAATCTEVNVTDPSGRMQNESLYWRYEVALKFLENRLNCVLGGTGGFYAVRRALFPRVGPTTVEDFQIVMRLRWAGYRVVYDPESLATEMAAPTLQAEFQRKVRIGAGCFQTLFRYPEFLNPFKGLPAFAYFSHKVMRWLAPLFLLAAFLSNLFLLRSPFFQVTLAAQGVFYSLALLGYARQRSGRRTGVLSVPLYFASMNLGVFLGLLRFLSGGPLGVWSTTPRSATAPAAQGEKGRA